MVKEDSVVLDDVRISDRNTVSVPPAVLRRLNVGPRDYLRFLEAPDGSLMVTGMALMPIKGSEIEQIADARSAEICVGQSVSLEQLRKGRE